MSKTTTIVTEFDVSSNINPRSVRRQTYTHAAAIPDHPPRDRATVTSYFFSREETYRFSSAPQTTPPQPFSLAHQSLSLVYTV
jgi:hypothetical protein